jgi:hypothetical protein
VSFVEVTQFAFHDCVAVWGTRKTDAGKMPFEAPFGKLRAGRTSRR